MNSCSFHIHAVDKDELDSSEDDQTFNCDQCENENFSICWNFKPFGYVSKQKETSSYSSICDNSPMQQTKVQRAKQNRWNVNRRAIPKQTQNLNMSALNSQTVHQQGKNDRKSEAKNVEEPEGSTNDIKVKSEEDLALIPDDVLNSADAEHDGCIDPERTVEVVVLILGLEEISFPPFYGLGDSFDYLGIGDCEVVLIVFQFGAGTDLGEEALASFVTW